MASHYNLVWARATYHCEAWVGALEASAGRRELVEQHIGIARVWTLYRKKPVQMLVLVATS